MRRATDTLPLAAAWQLAPCASSNRTGRQAGRPTRPASTNTKSWVFCGKDHAKPRGARSTRGRGGKRQRGGGGFFWVFSFFTRKQAPRSGEGTRLLYAHSSSPYIFLQPCERLHHNGERGREASVMCRRSIRLSFRPSVCGRSRRSVARASGSRGTDMPSALWCHPARAIPA